MRGQKASVFTWMGLFISATLLAIALAYGLNAFGGSLSPAASSASSVESPALDSLDGPNFAIQERYGRHWRHYATVSRRDGSFRQMFIAADQAERVVPGQRLPEDTLILMESWYSPEAPGIVFIKQKVDGRWQYGSFSPGQPDYRVGDRGSCHSCHAPFPDTDFTLTKPLLEAALHTQQLQSAYCDLPGRSPCAPEAYFPNSTSSG